MNSSHFGALCTAAFTLLAVIPALAIAAPAKSADTPHEGFVEVNGVRLHFVEQGTGPLILLLHGFPEFWYAWKDILPNLSKDHHVVALDMRGYNLSSMPDAVEQYAMPLLIGDVRAVAEHFGAKAEQGKKFVLVGHDWGGAVAWQFAYAHPELLRKLVILNAPHPAVFAHLLANDPGQQAASTYFNLFTSPQAETTLGSSEFGLLQQAVFLKWATEEDKQKYLECWRRGLTGGLNFYRAAGLKSPMSQEIADAVRTMMLKNALNVPTLVIWGMQDHALVPANLDGIQEYVKTVKILRMPDASHWVGQEQPAAVSAAIRDFTH
ncbi:MAG: alpha/beta hydrolase [Candidatus Acidiferrales bacterium]